MILDAASYTGHLPLTLGVVAVVLLVTMIIMLVGCADLCNKHFGFGRFVVGFSFTINVSLPAQSVMCIKL